jgi:hypothetical protein
MKQPQDWWVNRNGNASGPQSARQLKQAVLDGTISPQALVRVTGMDRWMPAGNVAGLFPAPGSTRPPPADVNPYTSPHCAVASLPVQAKIKTTDDRHWFVVHVTAWVMIGVAIINLVSFVGTAMAFLTRGLPRDEIDSPVGFALIPIIAALTIAGAIGALYRKRWGVVLLAAMTFLHCCLVMMFVIGDSFSECWKSCDMASHPDLS